MAKEVPYELYRRIPINSLILFCVFSVYSRKNNCSFEELTKECFELFPRVFCLKGISKWPDSRKLDRPLRALRRSNLIKGDPDKSFVLTAAGEKTAEGTAKFLMQKRLII